jgi:hypothetical protein
MGDLPGRPFPESRRGGIVRLVQRASATSPNHSEATPVPIRTTAAVQTEIGGKLHVDEVELPDPGPDQVTVKLH